jgi:hypothetical protein
VMLGASRTRGVKGRERVRPVATPCPSTSCGSRDVPHARQEEHRKDGCRGGAREKNPTGLLDARVTPHLPVEAPGPVGHEMRERSDDGEWPAAGELAGEAAGRSTDATAVR